MIGVICHPHPEMKRQLEYYIIVEFLLKWVMELMVLESYTNDVASALKTYFGFSSQCKYYQRFDDESAWLDLLLR